MHAIRLAAIGAAALIFGCGGGGGGGGGSPAPQPSKFFVADSGTSVIASVINSNPSAGTLAVDRVIQGASTGLVPTMGAFALDVQNNRLYVGNNVSIRVFNNASFADGNVAPGRTIGKQTGPAMNVASLFLDAASDRLYVGDSTNGAVLVFNSVSTLNNLVDPDRTITGFNQIAGVQVDTGKDILYVTNCSPACGAPASNTFTIRVFDGASSNTLTGPASPNRTITPNISTQDMPAGDLFIDKANDRLYVAGGQNTLVMVFDTASAADGSTGPNKTLTFPIVAGSNLKGVVLDTVNDHLYAFGSGVIFSLANVSSATGVASAVAALAPIGSSISAIAVSP